MSASGTQTIDNNLVVNSATAASAVRLAGGNNAAAALILNGNLTIGGNATALSTLNYSNQNVTINGRIIDSSSANVALNAPGGNLRLTNAANNFRGGIVIGSDNNPASLTVTSISNSGVSSAIGNGPSHSTCTRSPRSRSRGPGSS